MPKKEIPQILAIVPLSSEGRINLGKTVNEHLNLAGNEVACLSHQGEVLLQAVSEGLPELLADFPNMQVLPVVGRGTVTLPTHVIEKLDLTRENNQVALVQRPGAVALKRVEACEIPAEWASIHDLETLTHIHRRLETNPMPEAAFPFYLDRYSDLMLNFDVRNGLRGKHSLPAWKSRRLLESPDPGDGSLREVLIEERLVGQSCDGSWEGGVILTARALRELADLELNPGAGVVQRGADWLLNRSQSDYNPGMFFASDQLVAAQAQVLEERQRTGKGRFREIRLSEKRVLMNGDQLIINPCGPRIMWPNALVLEALLRWGYESNARVQAALSFMSSREWCECGYQHGFTAWGGWEPLTEAELEAFERHCIQQYQSAGIGGVEILLKEATLAKRTHYIRIAHHHSGKENVYTLHMPDHIQGCEFITTRALSYAKEPRLRRFAQAHLWRFAGIQRQPDGEFPKERYGTGFDQAGILESVSRYDHPALQLMLMRALPWVVKNQNPDGTWGKGERQESTTWAVLSALARMDRIAAVLDRNPRLV